MSELSLLRVLLLIAMAMGPLGTHRFFFAEPSRLRVGAHVGALACAALGLFLDAPVLCVAWLLFCAVSFALFLRERASRDGAASLRSPEVLAACVPFLFSNVAAVWLVLLRVNADALDLAALVPALARRPALRRLLGLG